MQTQTMTFGEKLDITVKAIELSKAGDEEGYMKLMKTIPMEPYMAKFWKEKVGVDVLLNSGWDLSEAEAEFGPNWISK